MTSTDESILVTHGNTTAVSWEEYYTSLLFQEEKGVFPTQLVGKDIQIAL